jgi:hypothetical protein
VGITAYKRAKKHKATKGHQGGSACRIDTRRAKFPRQGTPIWKIEISIFLIVLKIRNGYCLMSAKLAPAPWCPLVALCFTYSLYSTTSIQLE